MRYEIMSKEGEYALTTGRVEFPLLFQFIVITAKGEGEGPAVRRGIIIHCLHHDLVVFVSTHDIVRCGLRKVVVDIPHMDVDGVCTCGWRLSC